MAEKPSHADIVSQFEEHKARFVYDTTYSSHVSQNLQHPSYRAIIEMGEEAIPLLLRNVQDDVRFMQGIIEITGEDVAQKGDTFDQAVERWTEWGKERGYLKDEEDSSEEY